jgi:hypothetical protein
MKKVKNVKGWAVIYLSNEVCGVYLSKDDAYNKAQELLNKGFHFELTPATITYQVKEST